MPPSEDALIGRVIAGKFSLRQRIGVGAAGTVYRADQTSLGRTVAIKVLRPELACDRRFVRRFHDEARAASRLNHPNVVSVIDFGQTDDGLLYLVMEFLRGQTLTEVLRTEQLSCDRITDIIGQILSALEEAHGSGVVHADLKADNIMVERRRGGWDLIKVVDFGIARLTGHHDEEEDASDDSICGTPEYMAPEVIRGEEPTAATDIYAVGIILYELLVGFTPFSGSPTLEVLQRHLRETPVAPSEHESALLIPRALEQATLRALDKNPQARFPSVANFARALKAIDTRPVESPTKSFSCPSCGALSPTAFKFCPECGTSHQAEHKEFDISLQDTGHEEIWSDQAATADLCPTDLIDMFGPAGPQAITEELPSEEQPSPQDVFPLPLLAQQAQLDALARFITSEVAGTLYLHATHAAICHRLLLAACEVATKEGGLVFIAGADPTCQKTPFFPIRAIVAATLDLPPFCSYEEISEALEEIGLSKRDAPGIGELFQHEGGGLRYLEAPVRRRELFASTMRVLRAAGQEFSVVLAFEDFHLYDQPSQELLRQLCASNVSSPSLRLLITSDQSVSLDWQDLRPLQVQALHDNDLRAIVTHCATRGQPELITLDELRVLSDGDLERIHQLLYFALEGGDLSRPPESLADLLAARYSFLPSASQRVLQAAAIFGYTTSKANVVDTLSTSVGPVELRASLLLMQNRDLLTDIDGTLCFPSSMFRDVVYAATPHDVRRSLHRAAGDVLIATISDPAILGAHAEQGGDMKRAARLLARAGDNSVRQFDDAGAASLFNRALSATQHLLRKEQHGNTQLQLVSISIRLADTLRISGKIRLARGILDEAVDACKDAPNLRAQLLRASAQLRATEGNVAASMALHREVIALAIPLFEVDVLTDSYLDLATMCLRSGEVEDAIRELEEGINVVTMGEGPLAKRTPKLLWRLLLRLGQLHGADGRIQEAIEAATHAARLAEDHDSSVGIARSYATLAGLLADSGQAKSSRDYRRRAIESMRLLGDRRGTAELLLTGSTPTKAVRRISPANVREARQLAEEIGWDR